MSFEKNKENKIINLKTEMDNKLIEVITILEKPKKLSNTTNVENNYVSF